MLSKKFGILITARMGSSRLPDKHVLDLGGITPISLLIRRLKKCNYPIIISTGAKEENSFFEKIAEQENVEVFFGSSKNIPLRHLQTCEAFNLDFALSVDGDDILTAPEAVEKVANRYLELGDDLKNYHTKGYPFGMNCGGYSKQYLFNALAGRSKSAPLETGWGRIFPKDSFEEILCSSKNSEKWRLSLDYREDFEMFSGLWNLHKENLLAMSTEEILNSFEKDKFYEINEIVVERYWENFNLEMQREKSNE